MPDLFSHNAGYIIAAYAIAVLVVGALIVWVRLDGAARERELEDMRRRGLRRRAEDAGTK